MLVLKIVATVLLSVMILIGLVCVACSKQNGEVELSTKVLGLFVTVTPIVSMLAIWL